nr:EAL domain-containing protein [Kineococcus aurantiacus]
MPTVGFALAYTAALLLGRAARVDGSPLAAFWPAAAVAAVWVGASWAHRVRRLVAGAGVLALSALVDTLTGVPTGVAAALAVGDLVQTWVACALFHRWRPGVTRMTQREDAWALVGAAVGGSAAGALVTAWPRASLLGTPLPVTFLTTVTGGTATLTVAGLCLLLADRTTRRAPGAGWLEVVAVNAGSAAVFAWVFDVEHLHSLSFLVVAVSFWAGSRFPARVAAANALLVDLLHAVLALHGVGMFATAPPLQRLVGVQLFVLLTSVVTLVLVLHRQERAQLVTSLLTARGEAERQADLLRTVFDASSDGMSVYTAGGALLMANSSALGIYPTLPPGTPVERFGEFVEILDAAGDPVAGARLPLARVLGGESVESTDFTFRSTLDGTTRTVNVTGRRLPRNEGANWSEGALIAFHDVTDNRAAAARVARTRDLYAGILSGATEQLIVAIDLHGDVTVFNEGARRLLGHAPADVLGRSVELLHDPAEVAERAAALGIAPGPGVFTHPLDPAGAAVTQQWTLVRADGERRQFALTTSWLVDADGRRTGSLAVGTDVTEQVTTQARLADSETRFRAAFDTAPVGMLIVGLGEVAGRILQVNATMTEFTGLLPEELGVLDVHALVPAQDREEFSAHLAPLLAGADDEAQFEHRYVHADGGTGWGRTNVSRVSPAGVEPYLLCLVEDVTARKEAEQALVHQAMHDALTGLPNRALLRERLARALRAGGGDGRRVGVLLLDLDGFKAVNDTAGHACGDDVLREVAHRLSGLCRGGDTVARLGGDEFAVVCPDTDDEGLEHLARRLLAAVREPVVLGTGTFSVGASIGSAVHRAADADPGTLDRLLQNADLAMYAAKRAGKNRAYAYDHRDRERLERAERLLPELARAVADGEFEMFGQPIVELGSGRVEAVETLLRWRRADGTVLAPGAFLDVLEASPLMPAVGEFVLRASCAVAASWERALGADAPAVHVNVSAEQLGGSLVDQVDRTLAETGLSAGLLVLELTETHTTRITDALRGELQALRRRGVRIAIDDLGTGYSGLARLTELPVDLLKIDLQFVAGLGRDPSCDAVVRAVLGIGQALGIDVVAEGVEDDAQTRVLASYGATLAQGYRFARPAPAAELLGSLRRPSLAS